MQSYAIHTLPYIPGMLNPCSHWIIYFNNIITKSSIQTNNMARQNWRYDFNYFVESPRHTSVYTSNPAPPHCPELRASSRATSSMIPPRAQFITFTPRRHSPNTRALMRSNNKNRKKRHWSTEYKIYVLWVLSKL